MTGAKLIYLARRNPSLSKEAFPARWRQHSAFARPKVRRSEMGYSSVTYCLVEQDLAGQPDPGGEYDGLGLLELDGLHSIAPCLHALPPTFSVEVAEDEKLTFDRLVRDFTLFYAYEPLMNGPQTDWAILRLTRRPADFSPTQFMRAVSDAATTDRATPAVADSLQRYVQGAFVVVPGPEYQYDAIEEFWFPTQAEMLTALGALREAAKGSPIGADNTRLLTTNVVMNSRLAPLPPRP